MKIFFIAYVLSIVLFGNTYGQKSVTIGSQTWTSENLNTAMFANGDLIPEARTLEDWWKALGNHTPAWIYYGGDKANGNKYGKLYNMYAINDSRGLAPKGWHLPSKQEWLTLINFVGGKMKAGSTLKSREGWGDGQGNGSDSYGFAALPGGVCNYDGPFNNISNEGYWWYISDPTKNEAGTIEMTWHDNDVSIFEASRSDFGNSVRCIKN